MPPGNTLVGEGVTTIDTYSEPAINGSRPMMTSSAGTDDRIPHYVALLVILALGTLIAIRLGGLQGMIAVGR